MKKMFLSICAVALLCESFHFSSTKLQVSFAAADSSSVHYSTEKHLTNVKQLTFGGENAEAYWSFDNSTLTFQHTDKPHGLLCDQIFNINPKDTSKKLISTGKGRTTCSFFMPGDSQIIFASTHLHADTCPAEPAHVHGKYLWPIYPEYEIFVADRNGKIVRQLTSNKYYDAEAVLSPKGDKILFTSDRSGDLELYTMNVDGSNVKQITNELGYDGGANFSPDGKHIIWRASHFDNDSEKVEYRENLKKHLVSPMKMELFIANADGSNRRQLTHLGGANWAPNFDPTGTKIIFSSNHKTKTIPFNLFMIGTDGTHLEQITSDKVFDAFPMFSYDGEKLVWCSNRNNGGTRETNIFVADWQE
jgi:Tol biopolymer transport system component